LPGVCIQMVNGITQYIRDSPSNCILKSILKTYYYNPVKPPQYFSIGSPLVSIMHTRLRQHCSSLKVELFNVIWSILIIVAVIIMWKITNTISYTVFFFVNQTILILNNIRDLMLDISINNILYEHSGCAFHVNCTLFAAVQRYIIDSKTFLKCLCTTNYSGGNDWTSITISSAVLCNFSKIIIKKYCYIFIINCLFKDV
jgi:hypothetical protein